jgi:competence protein ComEC
MAPAAAHQQPVGPWLDRNILIPVTCAFMAGIAAAAHYRPSGIPALLLLLALCALAMLLLARRRTRAALFCAIPLFFLIGLCSTVHQMQRPLAAGHIGALVTTQRRVSLVGTLAAMVEYDGTKSRLVLEVEELRVLGSHDRTRAVRGRVRLSMRGRLKDLEPGDTLLVLATVSPVTNFKTPGVFDYKAFLAARSIHVSGWI